MIESHGSREVGRTSIAWLAALVFSLAVNAAPSPLAQAKDAGFIEELETGYVAATTNAPNRVAALVKDVNERRREAYAKIAKKNGITIEQVARESYLRRHPGR